MSEKPTAPTMRNKIGEEFMEFTHYRYLDASDQSLGETPPELESALPTPPSATASEQARPVVRLPKPEVAAQAARKVDLTEAIAARRSVRAYTEEALSLAELSYLLWASDGVREVHRIYALRTVPSAGARHPIETYVLVNRVDGVESGLYRFMALDHSLAAVDTSDDVGERVVAGCMGQGMVLSGAATFIWTAVPYRTSWRYGQRAYRYIHLDVGHVCQNLYLACAAVACGCCAIAAFDDDYINAVLGVDGKSEFTVYAASLGKV